MIRPRCLPGPSIAQKDSAPEFSHSLDPRRTFPLRDDSEHCASIALREKLMKIGAQIFHHGCNATLQMAEVAVLRSLF